MKIRQGALQAVYWKNGTLTDVPKDMVAKATVIYGTDVYILVRDHNDNITVWKNGRPFKELGPATQLHAFCLS